MLGKKKLIVNFKNKETALFFIAYIKFKYNIICEVYDGIGQDSMDIKYELAGDIDGK